MMYKSSDIALKDFYFDEGRNCVVSTKCPNEKDLIWRTLAGRSGLFVQLLNGKSVIKTIRKDQAKLHEVFDVLITASARNDMPYRSSPVNRLVSPEPMEHTAKEKETEYVICEVNSGYIPKNVCFSLKAAQDYAESRAKVSPGTKYAVIQIHGTVVDAGVVWK